MEFIWGVAGGVIAAVAGLIIGIGIGRKRERLDQYFAGNRKDW